MASKLESERTLDNQKSKYDDISWDNVTTDVDFFTNNFFVNPPGIPSGDVQWYCKAYWSTINGLYFEDLHIKNSLSSGSTETIFKKISYKDLRIKFHNNTWIDFDLNDPKVQISEASEGYTSEDSREEDPLYQRGFKAELTNYVDFPGANGKFVFQVNLQLSLVLRSSAPDFDPGQTQHCVQAFPQIKWSYGIRLLNHNSPGHGPLDYNDVLHVLPNNPTGGFVEQFRGSVVMDEEPAKDASLMMGPDSTNYVSFFTDSNSSLTHLHRKRVGLPDATFFFDISDMAAPLATRAAPFWCHLFDFLDGDLPSADEFVCVHDNTTTRGRESREESYLYPPDEPYTFVKDRIEVLKVPRQGAYDNIHVHGKMMPSIFNDPGVHAPFCGRSCVHLHWRWGSMGYILPGVDTKPYKGWDSERSNMLEEAPLIPPNQKLTIAVANTGHTRFSDDYIVDPNATINLNSTSKEVWYSVDIMNPDQNSSHVIFEQGLGYAYQLYNGISAMSNVLLVIAMKDNFVESEFPGRLDDICDLFSINKNHPLVVQMADAAPYILSLPDADLDEIYMNIYDILRYHYDDHYITDPTDREKVEQVPSGAYQTKVDGTTATANMRDL